MNLHPYANIQIIEYENEVDLSDQLVQMKRDFGAEKITIQSGGTLNAQWIRLGLIDHVSIVVAPCLIGGRDTQSLIGGESLHNESDLKNIRVLKLITCEILKNSYLHIRYDVMPDTELTT